ncbi:MAG: DUF2062 domain-containing protein [Phycisphaerae bacterium]
MTACFGTPCTTIPHKRSEQEARLRPEDADGIRVLIAIPTFNNKGTLRQVAERALQLGLPVLVVNDGSTDGGPAELAGLGVERIDYSENQGKGAAIVAAGRWAYDHSFTHLITLDGDGQHDPGETPKFLERIRLNPQALIVGRRDLSGAEVPRSSRFGRAFSNFWTRIACGVSHPDTQSGFRAYPVEILRRMKCRARRYDFEVEILVRSAWSGASLDWVDISARYDADAVRNSHFDMWWDNIRTARTYTRLVVRNLIPWPHRVLWPETMRPGLWQINPDREKWRAKGEGFSFQRPLRSLHTLLRERSSPSQLAAAAALGIFLGTLPLIACHSIAIIFCATRLRLNRLLALNVSHLCAPPLVPALAIELGFFVRHGRWLTEFSVQTLAREIHQRLLDYLIGSSILAPVLALCAGGCVYLLALTYRKARSGRGTTSDG